MTVKDHLRAARARIAEEQHWCQGELAENWWGRARFPSDHDACRWCLLGAIAVTAHPDGKGLDCALALAAQLGPNVNLATWNDTHTHAQVLALLDAAIAA